MTSRLPLKNITGAILAVMGLAIGMVSVASFLFYQDDSNFPLNELLIYLGYACCGLFCLAGGLFLLTPVPRSKVIAYSCCVIASLSYLVAILGLEDRWPPHVNSSLSFFVFNCLPALYFFFTLLTIRSKGLQHEFNASKSSRISTNKEKEELALRELPLSQQLLPFRLCGATLMVIAFSFMAIVFQQFSRSLFNDNITDGQIIFYGIIMLFLMILPVIGLLNIIMVRWSWYASNILLFVMLGIWLLLFGGLIYISNSKIETILLFAGIFLVGTAVFGGELLKLNNHKIVYPLGIRKAKGTGMNNLLDGEL